MTDQPSIGVTGPGGWSLKATGRDVILYLVAMTIVGATIYAMYLLWNQTTTEHKEIKEGLDNMAWILLQPPDKRAELAEKLKMPKSLKRKLQGEE